MIGCILKDKRFIANAFDKYFVNIEPELASHIPAFGINYRNSTPLQNRLSFFLIPVEEYGVKKVAQLQYWATAKDGIASKWLRYITDHIAIPLTRFTNLPFSQGVFPNDFKVALVSSSYKAKDPMFFSKDRLISLLPKIYKTMENGCMITYQTSQQMQNNNW